MDPQDSTTSETRPVVTPEYIMSLDSEMLPQLSSQKMQKRSSSTARSPKAIKKEPAAPETVHPFSVPEDQQAAPNDIKTSLEASSENSQLKHGNADVPLDLSAKKKRGQSKTNDDNSCICNAEQQQGNQFMIHCSGCDKWFHGKCVRITEKQAESFLKYYCSDCTGEYGPTTRKQKTNSHRHNAYERSAACKPTQSGTSKFMQDLQKRLFSPIENILEIKKGFEIDRQYLEEKGFHKPILIRDKGGLDIIIPEAEFHYADVVQLLGGSRQVLAIDVQSREDGIELTLDDFLVYMQSPPPREPILNIISLEFSATELSKRVIPPLVVRDLSWADQLFPEELPPESPYAKPEVQKYCLMSAQDSYTDFHIDFGGTSVWYHIFKGKKVFFLIAPTEANLTKYEEWMKSDKQSERFLGDECHCYRLELQQGETILMPSGWIHAVYTPEDSLVFGGNFLHHLGVEMQLKVNKMEDRLKTPERYRYPHFYTVCWYALNDMTERLAEFVEERKRPRKPPKFLVAGCKCLYLEFLDWMGDDEVARTKRHEVPDTIDPFRTMQKLKRFLVKLDAFCK